MPKKKLTYEEAALRLGEIVDSLNEETQSLEASLNLYKEGVTLAKFLKDTLSDYEGKITILKNSLEGETPFTAKDEENEL